MQDGARQAYREHGFWLSPVLLDATEVEELRIATARVVSGEYLGTRPPTLCMPARPSDRDLRKIDNAWWADPVLSALATDPRIADIAAMLLDASSVRLWQDQLLYKPPGDATTTTIGLVVAVGGTKHAYQE